MDLVERAFAQPSSAEVGKAFHHSLLPFGLRASYIRAYPSINQEEHVYSRVSPPGWESFYTNEAFTDINYLPREVRKRRGPFLWSSIVLRDSRERALAQALIDNGFPDGLAVPCHGALNYTGVVSLAFEKIADLSPEEKSAISMASLILHDRMRTLTPAPEPKLVALSPRERDCLGFIAEGMTDEAIADVIGISRTTVISHVNSARLKLTAKTRSQAVAKCVALGLI